MTDQESGPSEIGRSSFTPVLVTVNFRLEKREFGRAYRQLFYSRPTLMVLIPVSAAVSLAVGAATKDVGWLTYGVVECAMLILILVGSPALQWRRMPRLGDEQTQTFSDTGIDIRTRWAQTRFDWSAYSGVTEAGGMFLLKRDRSVANVVPRRAFASEGDEAMFRQLV